MGCREMGCQVRVIGKRWIFLNRWEYSLEKSKRLSGQLYQPLGAAVFVGTADRLDSLNEKG